MILIILCLEDFYFKFGGLFSFVFLFYLFFIERDKIYVFKVVGLGLIVFV